MIRLRKRCKVMGEVTKFGNHWMVKMGCFKTLYIRKSNISLNVINRSKGAK